MLLAGCAAPSISGAPFHQGFPRVAVLELPPATGDRQLRRVLHGKREEANAAALATDRQRINQSLESNLRASVRCFASSAEPTEIAPLDDPTVLIGHPIESSSLAKLQSSHPADAYLRLRVTDYGETPRRWKGGYIAFEVVTTLAIGAGLYVHKITRPVAGAYLLEETIEEFSEGYAGFWALNRLSRPVRIEADLVDGQSGQAFWRAAHTGLAPWRWRHLRHMDDTTRDELLSSSMRRAVKALSTGLNPGICAELATETR
jgi:hypothetical protein